MLQGRDDRVQHHRGNRDHDRPHERRAEAVDPEALGQVVARDVGRRLQHEGVDHHGEEAEGDDGQREGDERHQRPQNHVDDGEREGACQRRCVGLSRRGDARYQVDGDHERQRGDDEADDEAHGGPPVRARFVAGSIPIAQIAHAGLRPIALECLGETRGRTHDQG